MYCNISSSPSSSSSSTELGTGEGVERDCRLEDGEAIAWWIFWDDVEFDERGVGFASSFRPFEGESAEKR